MFAGRYLRWNMVALGLFVFFSIYFFYATWLGIRLSGCAKVVGSCGSLEGLLAGTIRPAGLLFAGILVLTSTVLRLHYLRFSLLWSLALFVWFGTSTDFFFMFGNLWMANVGLVEIGKVVPLEALFLVALCGFLCFPLEVWDERLIERRAVKPVLDLEKSRGRRRGEPNFKEPAPKPSEQWSVMYYVTGFTASYSFCFTIANSPMLKVWTYKITGSDLLVGVVQQFQVMALKTLGFGHNGIMPMLIAFAIFASTLSYLIVMRHRPPKTRALAVSM